MFLYDSCQECILNIRCLLVVDWKMLMVSDPCNLFQPQMEMLAKFFIEIICIGITK